MGRLAALLLAQIASASQPNQCSLFVATDSDASRAVRRVLERAGALIDENTVEELVTNYRSTLRGLPAPDDLQDEIEQVAGALVPIGQYVLG